MKKKNTVSFRLDPKKPPKANKADLKRLDAMRDSDIDYSDIPALDDNFWKHARVVRPAGKEMISLRLDKEVTEWFREQGKGYQSYINSVLRSFVDAHK